MKIPLSLYIHIPFCIKKCDYCDFLSFSGYESSFDIYVDALCYEIAQKAETLRAYEVRTIFIGGGTPTVLKPEQIGKILNKIYENFSLANIAEITIEANPKTVDFSSLSTLRRYGVNRVSFGFQSDSDKLLKQIGRIHDRETFDRNFDEAREAGFNNINVDIMYALPNQTLSDFESTLDYVLAKNPEHISAYGLILEEGTRLFDKISNNEQTLAEDDAYIEMYYLAKSKLKSAGYTHYEISNFAREGYKAKHNIVYWRCDEYVGFGLGSSSYIGSVRFHNENDFGKFIKTKGAGRLDMQIINKNEAVSEFMFMGLRMMEGVKSADFRKKFGDDMFLVFSDEIKSLEEKGLIFKNDDSMFLTDKGIDVSNYVFAHFI